MSRTMLGRAQRLAGMVAIAAAGAAGPVAAAPPDDTFFRGRSLTIVIATAPGGGYGLVTQLLQRHMPRHVPGQPSFIVQFMPGGGGQKAADWLYNVAPRDGYTIGMLTDAVALTQVLRGTRYDASKFASLGRMMTSPDALSVMRRTGVDSIEEAKRTQLVIAATAKGSVSYMNAMLAQNLLGLDFKIVTGYRGANPILLAMEKGEVDGQLWVWPTLKDQRADWLRTGTVKILLQVGLVRDPDLKDVPLMQELAASAEDRAVIEFVSSKVAIGRGHIAPPGYPRAPLDALRTAYMAMVKDPVFLDEAKKYKLDIDPLDGAAVQALIDRTVNTPKPLVERAKQVIGFQ